MTCFCGDSLCPSCGTAQGTYPEPPEECPVCGKPNSTEDGEWVCKEAEGFCSKECLDQYMKQQREEADLAAAEYENERRMLLDYNAKCPKCKGNDHKMCRHQ